MSRYLTPSRIGFLALISLYAESVVPSAATIPVLSFLITHILPIEPLCAGDAVAPYRNFTSSIDSFQKATISLASGIPGRTIWDLLLKKLWDINSFDALHSFFDTLSFLLEMDERSQRNADSDRTTNQKPILLSRISPLGAFVRRAQLEYTRLKFHDGIILWKSFVNYRTPTFSQWKRRKPAVGRFVFDANLQEDSFDLSACLTGLVYGDMLDNTRNEASVSTNDLEKLLEYQVEQMQSTQDCRILQ